MAAKAYTLFKNDVVFKYHHQCVTDLNSSKGVIDLHLCLDLIGK